ncbi:MAG: triose-phosphate isomerase [Planctomycetota bacterium]|nr:triose-phosphate isomerase [Planctomycetota bacterium]
MAARIPIIAGNWKMNLSPDQARELSAGLAREHTRPGTVEVFIFPPAPYLSIVAESTRASAIRFGAQNIYPEPKGAFTGETSLSMVSGLGGQLALVGHSERRHQFGETDSQAARKVAATVQAELTAVLCVGETLEQREAGQTESIVTDQIESGLREIGAHHLDQVVLAYEPVWAIGTGKTATPDQAQAVHHLSRALLRKQYGEAAASSMRILYGGSVTPDTISGLLARPDIDGALVGGASLTLDSFASIIQNSGFHS